jgi:APA family basic amino acid/polyamine antiporter
MLIGMDIYLAYGAKNSRLGNGTTTRKGMKIARYTGLVLAALLIVAGFLHQYVVGFESDRTLLYISIVFAFIHFFVFANRLGRPEPLHDDEPANPMENR